MRIRLWLLLIISSPLSAQPFMACLDMQHHVDAFYKKWHIDYPCNKEYSVKFSAKGINSDRYVIQIPKPYVDIANEEMLRDLVSIIPDKELRQKMCRNFKSCEEGALLYAFEGNVAPSQYRYKTYFDFGKKRGTIDSYEWQENGSPTQRHYVSFPRYRGFLETLLSEKQMMAFKAMRPLLDESGTMKKIGPQHELLCLKFKAGIKVADAKKYITELVAGLANQSKGALNRKNFDTIMASISSYDISWLSIGPDEIILYYRKQPWLYRPEPSL